MNDYVYVGFISGFFGLKGELKIISDENHLDKIFKENNEIVINDKKYIINTSRFYKGKYLIVIKDYEDINLINDFLKKDIYIKRCDIKLNNDEYLFNDLINMEVIDDKNIGKVSEILKGKNENFIKVNNIIIPLNKRYIKSIDIINKIIYAKDVEELMI